MRRAACEDGENLSPRQSALDLQCTQDSINGQQQQKWLHGLFPLTRFLAQVPCLWLESQNNQSDHRTTITIITWLYRADRTDRLIYYNSQKVAFVKLVFFFLVSLFQDILRISPSSVARVKEKVKQLDEDEDDKEKEDHVDENEGEDVAQEETRKKDSEMKSPSSAVKAAGSKETDLLFDPEKELENSPLLQMNRLNEWDFPIFELAEMEGNFILTKVWGWQVFFCFEFYFIFKCYG